MTAANTSRWSIPAIALAYVLSLAAPAMGQTTPAPAAAPDATTTAPAASAKPTATATASPTVQNTKPATTVTSVKLPTGDRFKTAALATAHCPGDTVVWSTLSKGKSYHLTTSKYYGKTKHGAYVCEKDANAAGFHVSKE